MFRNLQRFVELPSLVQGLALNPQKSWFSVIVPIERTNLITNPSFETNTTGWIDTGSLTGVTRDATQQYHGTYSCRRTTTASSSNPGMYFAVSLTSGNIYAGSTKFLCRTPNLRFRLEIMNTSNVVLQTKEFRSTGKWQWISNLIYTETSTTTRRFHIREVDFPGGNGVTFYIDGCQLEQVTAGNAYSTTFIDGDQQPLIAGQFPPAYGWNGTRHGSTSYRTAQTRDGGRVVSFDALKLVLTSIHGLGLNPLRHSVETSPVIDGARYVTSIRDPRSFVLSCRINTQTPIEFDQVRQELESDFEIDKTFPRQPLVLLYQKYNGLEPVSDVGKIVASYSQGLEGDDSALINEDLGIEFRQWLPNIIGSDQGSTITTGTTVSISNANSLMFRSSSGTWSVLDSQATNVINAITRADDGTYYVGGTFTSIGGTSANRIARYDPVANTFSALGTGLAGAGTPNCRVIRIHPNGTIWAGGTFDTAGGTTANNVAYWNGSTWSVIGGATKGVNGEVFGMDIDIFGNVYITGGFTSAGGSAANAIVKWDGSAFVTLGTGLTFSTSGTSVVCTLTGNVYVSGDFTFANGVACNSIAYWNGTTFSPLGTGLATGGTNYAVAMVFINGLLFVGGNFSSAGGVPNTARVAVWNGSVWLSLGLGVDGDVSEVALGSDGLLYFAGSAWTMVNAGIPVSDSFAIWNGTSWGLPDIDMPGTSSVLGLETGPRGELMFSNIGSSGSATAATVNTLTNDGQAATYPQFFLIGPSSSTTRVYQIRNYTTGEILAFNLTISPNEMIWIRCSERGVSIVSSTRGDISSLLVPGSSLTLTLITGSNSVSFFAVGNAITVTASWQKRFSSTKQLSY